MSIVAVVQARCGSTRMPNKVLERVGSYPLVVLLVKRLQRSEYIGKVIIATTTDSKDDKLVEVLDGYGIDYYRGSELDVLERYYQAASIYSPQDVVRVTGDCPLVDWRVVDRIIEEYKSSKADYCSNTILPTFPDGLDASIFSYEALERSHKEASTAYDREYVVTYMRGSEDFVAINYAGSKDLSALRLTVDEPIDLQVIRNIVDEFSDPLDISIADITSLYEEKPHLFRANLHIGRDEGSKYGQGFRLWKRAQQLIPNGNMLFSKRPELYAPMVWPTYYEECSGYAITDLDGNTYIDMLFAVGTNILGYQDKSVDEAVIGIVRKGNMATFNCPEEVALAGELCEMHPWAEMAKFAKTGGEANSIAIRIARAYSRKSNVAICGYHGWHDWYLAGFSESKDGLASHVTTGLQTNGVPKELEGTCYTFDYNDINRLDYLMKEKDIGVVKMEVTRNVPPAPGFLEEVRRLCTKTGAVLIFDECTSGFREELGGMHLRYGVWPDMAVFGKALGNGYPITCVLGSREVMESCKNTFISSTYWSDRIGFAAALATIKKLKEECVYEVVPKIGRRIKECWEKSAFKHGLKIRVFGYDAIPKFAIDHEDWPTIKTLFTIMMLNKGIVASNLVYVSSVHNDDVVMKKYEEAVDQCFEELSSLIGTSMLASSVSTPIACGDFKRLN